MQRLRREIEEDEEGVATTVGTIMALLIFLSILSLITQQYVPVWMEDNEAYHMDEVKGQFTDIKGGVDSLVVNDFTGYPRYSSVNLGTEGIPMFSGASPGRLSFNPYWNENENEGMSLNFTDPESDEDVSFTSSGNLSYHGINREFEDQTLIYEHGAIILEQSDGEIMRAKPHVSVENETDNEYAMSITLFHLTGRSRDLGGTSQVGVTTELVSTFSNTYNGVDNLNWTLTTAYPGVWHDYINNQTDLQLDPYVGNTIDIITNDDGFTITELELRRVEVAVELER